jgi:hypothetical protein
MAATFGRGRSASCGISQFPLGFGRGDTASEARFWKFGGTTISRGNRFSVERRTAIRYRLSVPVVFSWEGMRGDRFQGEGSTRDISAVGAYILTPTSPPVDATLQVEIMLSAVFGPRKARIRGRMRVQRVKHEVTKYGQSGFSVVGEWNELFAGSNDESEPGSSTLRKADGK